MTIDTNALRKRIEARRKALGGDTYAHAKPGEKWRDVRRPTKLLVEADVLEELLDVYGRYQGLLK